MQGPHDLGADSRQRNARPADHFRSRRLLSFHPVTSFGIGASVKRREDYGS